MWNVKLQVCKLLPQWSAAPTIHWGRQLPIAAITISQYCGSRSRYKIIFAVHAILKHPFLVLGFVYIGMACIFLLNTVIWITRRDFLLLVGGEGNDGLMVIYNSQKHNMMVIAPNWYRIMVITVRWWWLQHAHYRYMDACVNQSVFINDLVGY